MKRFLSLLQPHVIRAIIYSSIAKMALSLCVIFLWDRLLNQNSLHPWGIVDTGFFALAIWFAIGAWIQYLSLDGVRPFRHIRKEKGNRSMTAMDDGELDETETTAAKLCSNLILAVFYLIPSLIAAAL